MGPREHVILQALRLSTQVTESRRREAALQAEKEARKSLQSKNLRAILDAALHAHQTYLNTLAISNHFGRIGERNAVGVYRGILATSTLTNQQLLDCVLKDFYGASRIPISYFKETRAAVRNALSQYFGFDASLSNEEKDKLIQEKIDRKALKEYARSPFQAKL